MQAGSRIVRLGAAGTKETSLQLVGCGDFMAMNAFAGGLRDLMALEAVLIAAGTPGNLSSSPEPEEYSAGE